MNPEIDPIAAIKERYSQLPKELKDIILSPELITNIKNIGDKYGLLLDKQESLQRLSLLTLLGFIPSSQFKPKLQAELEVNESTINSIVNDVSNQIFAPIITHLREWEESLKDDAENDYMQETAGISVIDEQEQTENVNSNTETIESREEIIQNIENPIPAPRKIVNEYPKTDPLVDHLLTTPTIVPPQRIESKEGEAPKPPVSVNIPKRSGPDPYREPIN